uniref:Homeobox domain-containing protein n=1 Tax=Ditylenchus dipsaci TaxID=166011 RepID=A0A915EH54_9BILA
MVSNSCNSASIPVAEIAAVATATVSQNVNQMQMFQHTPSLAPSQPKKPRLVFTDIQRRTLQAIFKETKRPSREMQLTISQQLNLDPTTVANFFMNARRRGHDHRQQNNSSGGSAHADGNDASGNEYQSCSSSPHSLATPRPVGLAMEMVSNGYLTSNSLPSMVNGKAGMKPDPHFQEDEENEEEGIMRTKTTVDDCIASVVESLMARPVQQPIFQEL